MKHIADKGASLLEILELIAPDSSKSTLRSWIASGRVSVEKRPSMRANAEVLAGQEVAVGPKVTFIRGSLKILHDDNDIVVLEKPEGLLKRCDRL